MNILKIKCKGVLIIFGLIRKSKVKKMINGRVRQLMDLQDELILLERDKLNKYDVIELRDKIKELNGAIYFLKCLGDKF